MSIILRVSCGLRGRVRVSTGVPETVTLLRRNGWGCVFLDGVLHLLRGDQEVQHCKDRDPSRSGGDLCQLEFSSCEDPNLPAFRIDHAEFQVLGDEVLSWMMPGLHTLPWPKVATNWYGERPDNQDDLLRSVRLRIASAERAGWSKYQVLHNVPVDVRRAVSREKWAKFVREAGLG